MNWFDELPEDEPASRTPTWCRIAQSVDEADALAWDYTGVRTNVDKVLAAQLRRQGALRMGYAFP